MKKKRLENAIKILEEEIVLKEQEQMNFKKKKLMILKKIKNYARQN